MHEKSQRACDPADAEPPQLPGAVRRFLSAHVGSDEELVVLLALVDEVPAPLSPAVIADRLGLRVDLVHEALGALRARGLADRTTDGSDGSYRFAPADQALVDGVETLASSVIDPRTRHGR